MDKGKIDQITGTLNRYSAEIDQIMGSKLSSGLEGRVRFKREDPFRRGKQQAVYETTFSFPEGEEVRVIEKHSPKGAEVMEGCFSRYPIMRETFPALFYRNNIGFLAEIINGFEGEPYEEFVGSDPQIKRQLFDQSYEMFDEIFRTTPLDIWDVDVLRGHNIRYDQEQGRFRFFDYDMIQESKRGYLLKMIFFFERLVGHAKSGYRPEKEDVELLIHWMNRFSQDHGQAGLDTIICSNEPETKHILLEPRFRLDPQVIELAEGERLDQLVDYLGRPLKKEKVTLFGREMIVPVSRPYSTLIDVREKAA